MEGQVPGQSRKEPALAWVLWRHGMFWECGPEPCVEGLEWHTGWGHEGL